MIIPTKISYCAPLDSTDWSSDLDLATLSGAPPRVPDELHVLNETTSTEDLVLTNSRGETITYAVAPGPVPFILRIDATVIQDGTGSNIVVNVCWYEDGRNTRN